MNAARYPAGADPDGTQVPDPIGTQIREFAARHGVRGEGVDELWTRLRSAGVGEPGLAFARWAETLSLGGVLAPILANCPDVDTMLTDLERFHPLLGRDRIVLRRNKSGLSVELRTEDGTPANGDTVDACFALLARVATLLAGPAAAPWRAILRRRRPADPAEYRAVFNHVDFGSAEDCVDFRGTALRAPNAQADSSVLAALRPYAALRAADRDRLWTAAVRSRLNLEAATLTQVSRALLVSPRTLQVRLAAEQTSFAVVADATHRDQAIALLGQPDVPIADIATRIGFATPSAFTRAFRRWTGVTPTQHRADLTRALLVAEPPASSSR